MLRAMAARWSEAVYDERVSGSRFADAAMTGARETVRDVPSFEQVYREHFAFVFRNARRLGIPSAQVDDVVQDVFLVVHRRLPEYEPRAPMRAWLYRILFLVAVDARRRARRAEDGVEDGAIIEGLAAPSHTEPDRRAEQADARRVLEGILSKMPEERRMTFVLAELEQLSAPEIAEAMGENVNTVYSRLRLARRDFEAAVARYQARSQGRKP